MGTIFSIIIGVVVLFVFCGYIFSPKDLDPEENAKLSGMAAIYVILSMLPAILGIAFIVFIVKSCS